MKKPILLLMISSRGDYRQLTNSLDVELVFSSSRLNNAIEASNTATVG